MTLISLVDSIEKPEMCITRASLMEEMLPTLVHELAQPLTAINAYISGCIYRLTKGTADQEALLQAMNKVMQNIECAEQIILQMKNYMS